MTPNRARKYFGNLARNARVKASAYRVDAHAEPDPKTKRGLFALAVTYDELADDFDKRREAVQ